MNGHGEWGDPMERAGPEATVGVTDRGLQHYRPLSASTAHQAALFRSSVRWHYFAIYQLAFLHRVGHAYASEATMWTRPHSAGF